MYELRPTTLPDEMTFGLLTRPPVALVVMPTRTLRAQAILYAKTRGDLPLERVLGLLNRDHSQLGLAESKGKYGTGMIKKRGF